MRPIFTCTIAVLILTACSQPPVPTTSTPLPSITPTRNSTVTPTFSPTFTFTPTPPTPDLTPAQQEWETHFAGSAHVQEDGTIVDSVSGERIGSEADVWKYNEDGTYTRKYYPSNLGGEELTVTYRLEDIKIVLDENGKPTGAWDLSGWVKNEKGELVRETKNLPKKDTHLNKSIPGEYVVTEVFSKAEKWTEVLQSAKTASTGERVVSEDIAWNKMKNALKWAIAAGNNAYFTFDGVWVSSYKNEGWMDNVLTVNGQPVGTAAYLISAIGDGSKAVITWKAGGVEHVDVIDAPGLHDLANWDEWFKTHKPKW